LTSFRKKNHACGSNYGFILRTSASGEKINMVCPCVVPRASQRLKQIGAKAFEALGGAWLEEEKIKIAEDQKKCWQEGYDAGRDDACLYPQNSDQFLAWVEGHQRREEEIIAAETASNTIVTTGG
jgi:hypothetical protein